MSERKLDHVLTAVLGTLFVCGLTAAGAIIMTRPTPHDDAPPGPAQSVVLGRTIDSESPDWVPRMPGSAMSLIEPGQCGQWSGRDWHRIECPGVRP